jgi:hypothetical protein
MDALAGFHALNLQCLADFLGHLTGLIISEMVPAPELHRRRDEWFQGNGMDGFARFRFCRWSTHNEGIQPT